MSSARSTTRDQPLRHAVAVVAGAARGAGRGNARMLDTAGAIVGAGRRRCHHGLLAAATDGTDSS